MSLCCYSSQTSPWKCRLWWITKKSKRRNNVTLTFHLTPGVHALILTNGKLNGDFLFFFCPHTLPAPTLHDEVRPLHWYQSCLLSGFWGFFSKLKLDQRKRQGSSDQWEPSSQPKASWCYCCCIKYSLIILLEHTHRLTHWHTPPPALVVLLRRELGYRKTKWLASRHADGLSPIRSY